MSTTPKKPAKVQIIDMVEKNGIYLLSVKIKAGRYTFTKPFKLEPTKGKISVEEFKNKLKEVIIKEVAHRKAVEPIKKLKQDIFIIEYEDPQGKNNEN